MIKNVLTLLVTLGFLIPVTASAAPFLPNQGGTGNTGLGTGFIFFGGTTYSSAFATSSGLFFNNTASRLTFTNGSSTAFSSGTICFTGDICRTTWPSTSAASNAVATSSSETATYVPFWTSTNGSPALLSGGNSSFNFITGANRLNFTYASSTGESSTGAVFFNTSGVGASGFGTTNPTGVNANADLTIAAAGSTDVIASSTDNTVNSAAIFNAYAPGSRIFMGAHGATQNTAQYGIVVGGWAEIAAITSTFGTSNGMLFGTRTENKPLVFGNNGLERLRVNTGGNVGVASSSPWGLFSINANTPGFSTPVFVIGSSTPTGTTTTFQIDSAGRASTTNLTVSGIAVGAARCLQIDATGIVGVSSTACASAGVATSSAESNTQIPFWTTTAGTPAQLSGGNSTFTFTTAANRINFTNGTSTNFAATAYMEIPDAAAPILTVPGQIAVQTTAASTSLQVRDGGQFGLFATTSVSFAYPTSTPAGTTTNTQIMQGPRGAKYSNMACRSIGATATATVIVGNGVASSTFYQAGPGTPQPVAIATPFQVEAWGTFYIQIGSWTSNAIQNVTCGFGRDYRY